MGDFIVESRPRSFMTPLERPAGFVAEVRRSSRYGNITEPSIYSKTPEMEVKSSFNLKEKDYNKDKFDLALNDVLNKKFVSKDKLTDVMHQSIITLVNTLMKGYSVTKIQGSISVSLEDVDENISVDLNEDYLLKRNIELRHSPTELHSGIKFKGNTCSPLRSPESDISCHGEFSYFRETSPTFGGRDVPSLEASPVSEYGAHDQLSPPNIEIFGGCRRVSEGSVRSESEEESGYSSTDRESPSIELGARTCDTSDRESSMNKDFMGYETTVGNQERSLIADSDSEDSELVIDLTVPNACPEEVYARENNSCVKQHHLGLTVSHEEVDTFDDLDKEQNQVAYARQENAIPALVDMSKYSDEQQLGCCSNASTDVPMDLSGDCLVNVNIFESRQLQVQESPSVNIQCKTCPAILPDTIKYEEHTLQCHQLYACSICMKDFSSKNNLKRHVRIHTGSRPYKCGQCDMTFARKDDLKGHTLKHDFSKPFRCSLCKKGYTDRACVKNHMSKEHCSRLMHICPQCGESFDRDETFLEHKKTHASLKQFACDICPFTGTNHLMALKHKLLHSYKLFSCKPCNAYFADPFGYTKHVRKHKKSSTYTSYVCCFCDAILPTYEQFVRHEYSHAQGKPHECSVCQKQFKSKTSMIEHALVHSSSSSDSSEEDKPYPDRADIEMKCPEANDARSPIAEPENSICRPNVIAKESEVMMLPRNDEHVVSSTVDSFEGKLLDLSIKPTALENSQCPLETAGHNGAPTNFSSQRILSASNNCVPRNGCAAIGTHFLQLGKQSENRCEPDYRVRSKEDEFQVVWQSPVFPRTKQLHAEERDAIASIDPIRVPQVPSEDVKTNNKNLRFHPYNRMYDLASKFMAARGNTIPHKIAKDNATSQPGMNVKNEPLVNAKSVIDTPSDPAISNIHNFQTYSKPSSPEETQQAIGLFGNPCIASINLEEPSNKEAPKHIPFIKQEVPEVDTTPSPAAVPIERSGTDNIPVGVHTGSTPGQDRHECDVCKSIFDSFFQLESHSVVHHSRYLCEFCGKGFTARPNRDRHVRYHTGERPYKCELCTCAFFRGDDLKYHRTTRHPTEQISCGRCSASFTWRKDLERHMRHSKCVA